MVRSPYKSSLVRPVRISGVNWIGVKTLYLKEVHRFLSVPTQTLLGPVVTAVLFMMIFSVVVGERVRPLDDDGGPARQRGDGGGVRGDDDAAVCARVHGRVHKLWPALVHFGEA